MLSTSIGLAVALTGGGIAKLQALPIGTNYSSTDPGTNAQLFLNFRTNGTWDFTVGASDTLGGTPTSGTWLPAGANAADYEVKYTVTAGPAGAGVVTNGASAYSALTANRSIDILILGSATDSDTITVTVDLRRIAVPSDAVQKTGINMTASVT